MLIKTQDGGMIEADFFKPDGNEITANLKGTAETIAIGYYETPGQASIAADFMAYLLERGMTPRCVSREAAKEEEMKCR